MAESNVVQNEEQQEEEQREVNVNIRCSNGTKLSVKVRLDLTVGSFKDVVAGMCDVPADQQRLIYKGRILKDDQTLKSFGLGDEHTVHLVRGFASSASTNTPATPNPAVPNTTSGNSTSRSSTGSGPGGAFGLGDSLFNDLGINGLGGPAGLVGPALPDFDQVQQQLAQNPDVMREMMNSPLVQNVMNNPEIMRNLIMNNPQMRELIDRNPELGHILNDPSILRQTLETARNPELMREMMRNTDRAMSNIEATPEGFNMLRRMYENVQEPLMNATMAGNAAGDSGNPFAALLGTQGDRQAADRSTYTSNNTSETNNVSPAPNANPLPNPWTSAGTGRAQTNTNTNTVTSNPAGEVRSQAPAALGGLGLPGLEGMLGTAPDTNMMNQLMQNPAISQMMQSMLSNPQYMNQILNLNPQLRSTFDSNPQLREMLQNPELLRQLTSPETLQQMLAVQQSLQSQLGQRSSQGDGQAGGGTGTLNNASLESLMNMFGGLGTGSLGVPNPSNVPPEELYATQLSQLQEMGFFDAQENIRALVATAGNVHAAVERLLGNPGQ